MRAGSPGFKRMTRDKGVALVAISPNDPAAVRLDELGYTDVGDSFEDMKIRAKDHKFAYPYLYDGETQATALAYGVLATPQVYVFDADRKLRYVGRFDDSEVKAVKSHELEERRRRPAGGQAGPGREDARLRLLDQVGRKAKGRSEILGEVGCRAGHARDDRRSRAWPSSPRTTPRSCCW